MHLQLNPYLLEINTIYNGTYRIYVNGVGGMMWSGGKSADLSSLLTRQQLGYWVFRQVFFAGCKNDACVS